MHNDKFPAALGFLHTLARRSDGLFDRFALHFDSAPTEQNLERTEGAELKILLRNLAWGVAPRNCNFPLDRSAEIRRSLRF